MVISLLQVIRFTGICHNIDGVRVRISFLLNLLVSLGFDLCEFIKTFTNCIKGGGVQGLKSWKHDFEITGDPKGPPIGSTFWSSFEAPNP